MSPVKNRVETLAAFAAGCRSADIPSLTRARALAYIKDTLGCMLLGATADSARILRAYLAMEDRGQSCTIAGTACRASADGAAMANAAAAHAFDLDDVGAGGHSSAVMLSAALAAAEEVHASGFELLTAFCIGMEVGGRVDDVLMSDHGRHYARGWHNTATSGPAGAAACCGVLYGLSEEALVHAIANAANFGFGLCKSFGSMTKHLNAGEAARIGIMAAKLAKLGFRSNPEMMEAPSGLFECFTEAYDDSAIFRIGTEWCLDRPRIQKLFASCGFSHRGICAVLDHYDVFPRDTENIRSIVISLPEEESRRLLYSTPQTGSEGSFSAEYTVAAALLDGAVTLDSFTDRMVQRPEAKRLMSLTRRETFPGAVYTGTETVTVEMNDGRSYTGTCDDFAGGFRRPLTEAQLRDKFLDCAAHSLGPAGAKDVFASVSSLDTLSDVCQLTGLMIPQDK